MFGVVWDRGRQEGDFGIVSEYPLNDGPEFGDYEFPKPDEVLIREKCERLLAHEDLFKIYGIGFSLFERAWTLRSMENLASDIQYLPAGSLRYRIFQGAIRGLNHVLWRHLHAEASAVCDAGRAGKGNEANNRYSQ